MPNPCKLCGVDMEKWGRMHTCRPLSTVVTAASAERLANNSSDDVANADSMANDMANAASKAPGRNRASPTYHSHRSPKPKGWKSPVGSCCGAWAPTRKRACHRWPLAGRARCSLHGGLSRGPATLEGRKVISEMRKREWAEHRALLGLPESWRSRDNRVCRQKRESAAKYLERHGSERS